VHGSSAQTSVAPEVLSRRLRNFFVWVRHSVCVGCIRLCIIARVFVLWFHLARRMSDNSEDELKLQFTLDAVNGINPFATHAAVHQDVADALRWQAERSPQQVCIVSVSRLCGSLKTRRPN